MNVSTSTLPKGIPSYLGLSATTVALLPSSASGVIVYSGVQDLSIGQGSAQDLNLDGDAYNDILLKNYIFGGNYQGATVNFAPGKVVGFTTGLNYASLLPEGYSVESATTASGPFNVSLAYANNADSQFDNAVGGFIGLEFPINAVSHFGWIRVTIDNAAGTFVINDWAYENVPGEGILTGAVPEPSSLALLASGGILALRRKRQKQAA